MIIHALILIMLISRIPVVIDCSHMYHLDYTAAAQFTEMMKEFSSRQQEIFWLSPNMRVADTIKSVAGDLFIRINSPHQVNNKYRVLYTYLWKPSLFVQFCYSKIN